MQIRIAKPKQKTEKHREFNDLEKQLNELKTSKDFIEFFTPKINIYKLKAIPDAKFEKDGYGGNPCRALPEHRLKQIVKYIEATPEWYKNHVEPVINTANWVFLIKDVYHKETSECMAIALAVQNKIRNTHPELADALRDDTPRDEEKLRMVADIIQSVVADFDNHWSDYMDALNKLSFEKDIEKTGVQ